MEPDTPIPQLCDVCTVIDFERVAPSKWPCDETQLKECIPGLSEQHLGTAEEIFERAGRCSFCALIARCLKTHADLDPAGNCYLMGGTKFCVSSHQTHFTKNEPHIHTMIALIQLRPKEAFSWPALPWELDLHESHPQRVRNIMVFQVDRRTSKDKLAETLPAITGRKVEPLIDMSLVQKWLATCEQSHVGRCPHDSNTPSWGDTFQPAFVIDVRSWYVTRPPSNCRYIALSYVWGRGKMLKHTNDNSSTLQTPGALRVATVPKTIRDALVVTERIGERYLWVDALCIVQDDALMQQIQIAKMHLIYANALLTIVATSGDSAEAGLPGVGPNLRGRAQDIVSLPNGVLRTVICDTTATGKDLKKSPWMQRAWTMQELLCSGRCLIFTTSQVYWRCQCAVWLEEVSLEETVSNNLEIFPATDSHRFPDQNLDKYQYFELFGYLLDNYLRRQLSFKSDLINAFSGICNRLSMFHSDTFFWGLPQSHFSTALGWRLYSTHCRSHAQTQVVAANGGVEEIPFPTWSWAAWSSIGIQPWINFNESYAFVDYDKLPLDSERNGTSGDKITFSIDFWISDVSGRIIPIMEPGSHLQQERDRHKASLNPAWQDVQRGIPQSLAHVATVTTQRLGLLYFWTSALILDLAIAEDRSLVPFIYNDSLEFSQMYNRDRPESVVGYIVVGITEETEPGSGKKKLIVLVVEWKDGIAYRLGSDKVREEYWVAIERREWKFVILG